MITDPGLLELFAVESQEHLHLLDVALLSLERAEASSTLIADMLRAAHSLKGAARVIGLADIESLAHHFEDVLAACQRGEVSIADQAGKLGRCLKAFAALTREATSGEDAQVDLGAELAALTAPTVPGPQTAALLATPPVVPAPALPVAQAGVAAASPMSATLPLPHIDVPQPVIASAAPPSSIAPSSTAPFRIESVRVPTEKLDALLKHSGELRVNRGSIARRLEEVDALAAQIDERLGAGRCGDSDSRTCLRQLAQQLETLRASLRQDSTRLTHVTEVLCERIRELRLLPMQTLFGLFPRMVHDLAKDKGKRAELLIEGGDLAVDKRILEEMKDPLTHLLRNAVDHGIELPDMREQAGKPGVALIRLRAIQTSSRIVITVSDDGAGLDVDMIAKVALKRKLVSERELAEMSVAQVQMLVLNANGLSTSRFITETSGRGVGLGVARVNVERLKGQISLESTPAQGLSVRIDLPVTLATMRVLLVRAGGQHFALPADQIRRSLFIERENIYTIEGKQVVQVLGQVLQLGALHTLLSLPDDPSGPALPAQGRLNCVIIESGDATLGLIVQDMVGEEEVMLHQQSRLLQGMRHLTGVTIRDNGDICVVLNARALMRSASRLGGSSHVALATTTKKSVRRTILLAEDSLTTRTQEKRILEAAGYAVTTAVDGRDAYLKLTAASFDALVTDIQMPNMDGLQLTRKLRQEDRHAALPVVLVTTQASDVDKLRGLEAGANAYIAKSAFDQRALIECLDRLI